MFGGFSYPGFLFMSDKFLCDFSNKQEGDGDFSEISSEENDLQVNSELISVVVGT